MLEKLLYLLYRLPFTMSILCAYGIIFLIAIAHVFAWIDELHNASQSLKQGQYCYLFPNTWRPKGILFYINKNEASTNWLGSGTHALHLRSWEECTNNLISELCYLALKKKYENVTNIFWMAVIKCVFGLSSKTRLNVTKERSNTIISFSNYV